METDVVTQSLSFCGVACTKSSLASLSSRATWELCESVCLFLLKKCTPLLQEFPHVKAVIDSNQATEAIHQNDHCSWDSFRANLLREASRLRIGASWNGREWVTSNALSSVERKREALSHLCEVMNLCNQAMRWRTDEPFDTHNLQSTLYHAASCLDLLGEWQTIGAQLNPLLERHGVCVERSS